MAIALIIVKKKLAHALSVVVSTNRLCQKVVNVNDYQFIGARLCKLVFGDRKRVRDDDLVDDIAVVQLL